MFNIPAGLATDCFLMYGGDTNNNTIFKFAAAAGVAQSRVSLEVTAASVRLAITIQSGTQQHAEAAVTQFGDGVTEPPRTPAALRPKRSPICICVIPIEA